MLIPLPGFGGLWTPKATEGGSTWGGVGEPLKAGQKTRGFDPAPEELKTGVEFRSNHIFIYGHWNRTHFRPFSLHALPCGLPAQICGACRTDGFANFNPLAPCGARRTSSRRHRCRYADFNPLAPCGARLHLTRRSSLGCYFNPLAPCGARPRAGAGGRPRPEISIHSPHAGRDAGASHCSCSNSISIHSPHAGRDPLQSRLVVDCLDISIHSPHAGRDLAYPSIWRTKGKFQSTRPMRGETLIPGAIS